MLLCLISQVIPLLYYNFCKDLALLYYIIFFNNLLLYSSIRETYQIVNGISLYLIKCLVFYIIN